jgi:class 3 adenylate cyclase
LTTQTFRNLFKLETIEGSEGLGIKDLTILFTDLKGSTALYDRIGDLKAFSLVQRHFDILGNVTQSCSGAMIKTIGDAIMASFMNPFDAVKCALLMLDEIDKFNAEQNERVLILKIGIHKGASIAVTLNERIDYFGQMVNIASRVQGLADADEIYITDNVYTYPGVDELLKDCSIQTEMAKLKGIQDEMKVYKIKRN